MVQCQSLTFSDILIPCGVTMQRGQRWQFEEAKHFAQERKGNAWNLHRINFNREAGGMSAARGCQARLMAWSCWLHTGGGGFRALPKGTGARPDI